METQVKDKPSYVWAVPESLKVPVDALRCRLDFHHQAVVMTLFDGDLVDTKVVSAQDVTHALATELSFGSGLARSGTVALCGEEAADQREGHRLQCSTM